jgi:hypothetical protein
VRTNRVEADAIVEDVMRRFRNSPREVPSLGVITFNAQQRDLIENLLRQPRRTPEPPVVSRTACS